jgi:DNA-binding PadR family transcriptional regulator
MPDVKDLSPLAFHILLSLLDGERHGYALKREISARTDKKLVPGPSLLYSNLNRLLEQGLIVESADRPDSHLDDERRRYYSITPEGIDAVQAEARRMKELVRLAGAYVAL